MKPTNSKSEGCVPVSSNCVIWQGPDIECISLCKGDTVSDVVYKLATELCTLMDTFGISNYDLTCFNLAECAPKDFVALINLLIQRICDLENVSPTPSTPSAGCPDCVVNICSQFYYTNELGDLVTTMQLRDYVLAIGNRVCTIIGQITTINATLADHEDRITDLENVPAPTYTLPTLTPVCIGPDPLQLDAFTVALEQAFCNLQNYTGNPTAIVTAMNHAITGLGNMDKLCGVGLMNSLSGWILVPASFAQSFQNLWLTVADMRCAIQQMQLTCCNSGCSAIDLVLTGTLSSPTDMVLIFGGNIPNNFVDDPMGSTITVTDGIATETINGVKIFADHYNVSLPYNMHFAVVNGSNNITVSVTYRFIDPVAGTSCEGVSQLLILGTDTCPTLMLVADYTAINYSFTWNGTIPTTVQMQVWQGAVMVNTHSLYIDHVSPSGSFTGLTEGTAYTIRVVIDGIPCSFADFTTLAHPCVAPGLLAPTITYTTPEGTTNGTTITAWYLDYVFYHPVP
jgi:hypothetical protein